jgi:hypothetical protein
LCKAASDRGDLIGFQPGRRDNFGGLLVAYQERHVGAHHHARPDHLQDKQHPGVMQDAVNLEQRPPAADRRSRARDLVVALEAFKGEGKYGGAHGHENLAVAVAMTWPLARSRATATLASLMRPTALARPESFTQVSSAS